MYSLHIVKLMKVFVAVFHLDDSAVFFLNPISKNKSELWCTTPCQGKSVLIVSLKRLCSSVDSLKSSSVASYSLLSSPIISSHCLIVFILQTSMSSQISFNGLI